MKKIISLCAVLMLLTGAIAQSNSLPALKLKNIEGRSIDVSKISNNGKPIIVSFWATWCKPCVLELNTIAEDYEEWQDETGVKLVAVSIDDQRNLSKVEPFVNGKSWEYEVLLDPNGDLKRAMNVNNVPHTFLLDGNGKIVYSHNKFSPGDEEELYHKIEQLVNKKK